MHAASASGLKEPTDLLTVGEIVDGEFLKRVGTTIVSAAGGGSDSRLTTAVGTAGANTTSNTTGVTTGIAFTLATGEYIITCVLRSTTAATTTAPRFSMVGSGGLVVGSLDLEAAHDISAVATQTANANALAGWTVGTTGSGATARPTVVTCRVRVTTGGVMTLWMRSEVSGSLVTMVEGSGFAVKVA